MQKIKPNSIIAYLPEIHSKKINGKWYLLISHSDEYIELNETASFVWELLQSKKKVADVILQFAHKYDLTLPDAESDVIELIQQLADEKLLSVK